MGMFMFDTRSGQLCAGDYKDIRVKILMIYIFTEFENLLINFSSKGLLEKLVYKQTIKKTVICEQFRLLLLFLIYLYQYIYI